ncbi:MAG: OsmC family protein [Pseudomonadota bacterium]|nr:OsmC family protein [Pseudomonadota bacterium]
MLRKISIATGIILGLVVIGGGIYWFSIPKEARNMMTFMMFTGGNYENYEVYQVIERNETPVQPAGPEKIVAESTQGDNNVNIVSATEMVQNNTSSMLKRAYMQRTGINDYTGWAILAVEGAEEGEYPYGPSPLSYYTAGVATNLHTQIDMAARAVGVVLDDVTVEVVNDFNWDRMMDDDGTGHLAKTAVSILVESEGTAAEIKRVKEIAIDAWAAGQALMNKTAVSTNLMINGDNWDNYHVGSGTSESDESYDGDLKLSSVTPEIKYPKYAELWDGEDAGMSIDTVNNLTFQIYAISETLDKSERPDFKRVTISSPTGETWEMYSDEFMSEDDKPLAPTSLEYFTVGTTLCLTSQTTLVGAMMGIDYDDYRVEHRFEYSQKEFGSSDMKGSLDMVHSYVFIDSDESKETLEKFFSKSLALCFAGEGLVNETEMDINTYLNGNELR